MSHAYGVRRCSTLTLTAAQSVALSRQERGSHCPICLMEMAVGEPIVILPCNGSHAGHWECMRLWLQRAASCPTCRFDLPHERDVPACEALVEASTHAVERLRIAAQRVGTEEALADGACACACGCVGKGRAAETAPGGVCLSCAEDDTPSAAECSPAHCCSSLATEIAEIAQLAHGGHGGTLVTTLGPTVPSPRAATLASHLAPPPSSLATWVGDCGRSPFCVRAGSVH